jgi:hypothetical protein
MRDMNQHCDLTVGLDQLIRSGGTAVASLGMRCTGKAGPERGVASDRLFYEPDTSIFSLSDSFQKKI